MPQAEFKVVILGDSHIGKTSLVTRFAEGYYRENSRPATVGAFFITKRIQSTDNTPTKIQIWDTAGAESFRAMAPMFYENAAAVIVCYDVTSRESFDGMREWLDEVRRKVKVGEEAVVAIAGLKTDLLQDGKSSAAVPEYEVEQLAEALGVLYLPTSAKLDTNVKTLFQRVADRVLQNRKNANIMMAQQQNEGGNNNMTAMDNDGVGGGDAMLLNRDDLNYSNGNNSAADDRIRITSPRKRDEFDKYYVSNSNNASNNNSNNEHGNQKSSNLASKVNENSIPPDEGKSPGNGKNKRNKKHNSKNKSSPTRSTDGTATEDDGGHPLLAKTKEKKKRGQKNSEGGGLCSDELYFNCQPVACGAGDGSSGCIVQ